MAGRVLLISQYCYPRNMPGAHRCAKLAKYLPRFGWTPVVLGGEATRENSAAAYDPLLEGSDTCEVVRVSYPHHSVRSVPGLLDYFVISRIATTCSPWGLYRRLVKRGCDLLRREGVDVIWATSPDVMVLNAARMISRKSKTPWVADLRDLMHETARAPGPFKRWRIRLETAACRSASALITVTRPLADRLAARHTAPVHVVPNGFDPDDFSHVEDRKSEYFDIVYSGAVYAGRDPSPLFEALDAILEESGDDLSRLRARFYGVGRDQLDPHIRGRPCARLVQVMGRVPLREMLEIQQRASVLLLLSHANVEGLMPYKIFEYLGAGRTILSVPGDASVTDALLQETRAGAIGRNAEEIARLVRGWYAQWANTGEVEYHGLPETIGRYTREKQAEQTAEVLNAVCNR